MDSDTVDSTGRVTDRFKRPGTRKQPMVDLKYITFGFSYLQVKPLSSYNRNWKYKPKHCIKQN